MSTVRKQDLDRLARDKYFFGNKVFNAANEKAELLDLLGWSSDMKDMPDRARLAGEGEEGEGRRILVPIDYQGSANKTVAFTEQGSLADPGKTELEWLQFYVAGISQSLVITKLADITTAGGKKSLVKGIMYQMKRQLQNAREGMNWHMHRNGSGELARCGTTTDTNVVVLDSNADMSMLVVGTRVVIRNRSTGALITAGTASQVEGTALEVTARSVANKTITVATETGAAVQITTTNAAGVYAFDSQGAHVNGLGVMCSSADPEAMGSSTAHYGGLARSSNDWHQANQLNAADTAWSPTTTLSVDYHLKYILNLLHRVGPERADYWGVSGYDNFDLVAARLEQNQVTQGGFRKKLTGGYDGIEYQNLTMFRDRHADYTRLRVVPKGLYYRYVMRNWGWDDTDGSIWSRQTHRINGRPTMVFRANLITYQQAFSVQDLNFGEIYGLSAAA